MQSEKKKKPGHWWVCDPNLSSKFYQSQNIYTSHCATELPCSLTNMLWISHIKNITFLKPMKATESFYK